MRNIMHTRLTANMLLIILVLIVGCNNEATTEQSPQPDNVAKVFNNIDDSAVTTWFSLGDKFASGEEASLEDFASLLELPAYKHYSNSNKGSINNHVISNITKYIFQPDEVKDSRGRKHSPKRTDLIENFKYIKSHREQITNLPEQWSDKEYSKQIHDLLKKYLPANLVPNQIELHLMVCELNISYGGGSIVSIDAGLALATPEDKIVNMAAAHCYRVLRPLEFKPYEATTGKSALRQTFSQIRIEAIVSVIEDYPNIYFDYEHPLLSKEDKTRNNYFTTAQFNISRINGMLKQLFISRDSIDEKGATIDDLLRYSRSYQGTGYAMAMLIIDQLGQDRLISSAASNTLFFQAYQEAALTGKATGDLAKLHPFDEEVLADLLTIFPTK
ncbi:hypothetical protein HN388_05505 [bacterium]|nr:hypothetical protein [bacterium]MBT4292864.1 hypothetical protein [bacterium]MBT7310690.1 hypothetical protein [bacterium]